MDPKHGYFFKLSFYWSKIALRFCDTFCCKTKRVSYMNKYIPSSLDLPATSPPIPPSRSSQSPELSFLCFIASWHQLSVLHMVVYVCQPSAPSLSHPRLLPLHVHTLRLHFYSCPGTRLICTTFLESTYMR